MSGKHYREVQQAHKTKGRRKKHKKKHGSLLGTVLILFLSLVILIGGSLFYLSNRMLNQIGRVDKEQEIWLPPESVTLEPEEIEETENEEKREDTITPERVVWNKPAVVKEKKQNVKNILLIGQDARPGESRARSDTMILCSVNVDTKKVTLVSLMRDMYVPFPADYDPTRINHAYAYGGMSLLDQVIEDDFGIPIDGNFEVNFNGFIDVMNIIGPLEIELKSYEVGYMNGGTDWNLHQGLNVLNSEQLLRYARMRYAGHGDWERTERQRTVLRTAFQKVKNLSLKEITALADAALPCLTTDMSNSEIMSIIYTVITNRMSIGETYRLPVEGSYSEEMINGMAVLVPDLQMNSDYLYEYIYGK